MSFVVRCFCTNTQQVGETTTKMGQTASKVVNRVVGGQATLTGAASKVKPERHIPSIPGKSGAVSGSIMTDPISGFTRGTSPLTPSEEKQRQFLEGRHGRTRDASRTGAPPTMTTSDYMHQDKLPDDLLKFITDMGPVVANAAAVTTTTTEQHNQRPRRAPRLVQLGTPDTDDTTELAAVPVSTNPAHDHSRHVVNMPLATNIPGYETSRTTSFSNTPDIVDPNDIGLDVVQLYSLVTCKSSMQDHLLLSPFSNENQDQQRQEQQVMLENIVKYIQVPVLLKDTDGGYVGAWPEKVQFLIGAHRGMIELDTETRAKLVLQDLWETKQNKPVSVIAGATK
jgi:hypothetical protein